MIVFGLDIYFVRFIVLYLQLFNVLFDETYDLKLSAEDGNVDKKVGNWNKINAVICFNYF